jgi:hypothetical protein
MCNKEVIEFIGVQFLSPPAERQIEKVPIASVPAPTGPAPQYQATVTKPTSPLPPQLAVSATLPPPPPGFEKVPLQSQVTLPHIIQPYRPPQLHYEVEHHRAILRNKINFHGLVDLLCNQPPPDFGPIKSLIPATLTPYQPLQVSFQRHFPFFTCLKKINK